MEIMINMSFSSVKITKQNQNNNSFNYTNIDLSQSFSLYNSQSNKKQQSIQQILEQVPYEIIQSSQEVQTDEFLIALPDKQQQKNIEIQTDVFNEIENQYDYIQIPQGIDEQTQVDNNDMADFDVQVQPILDMLVGTCIRNALTSVAEEKYMQYLLKQKQDIIERKQKEELLFIELQNQEKRKLQIANEFKKQEQLKLQKYRDIQQQLYIQQESQLLTDDLLQNVIDQLDQKLYFTNSVENACKYCFTNEIIKQGILKAKQMQNLSFKNPLNKNDFVNNFTSSQIKFGVFYSSTTGNNKHFAQHICEIIKQNIQDAEFQYHHIEEICNKLNKQEKVEFDQYDAYIIGSFVSCYSVPQYMDQFIQSISNQLKEKPVLTFLAHGGGAGIVGRWYNQELLKYNAKHLQHVQMKYCNNYAGLTYPKNENERQGINIKQYVEVDKQIKDFCDALQQNKNMKPKFTKLSWIQKNTMSPLIRMAQNSMKQKIIIDQDKCIKCLKCYNNCPENCFSFENNTIQFKEDNNCVGCRFCMQNCPQKAIDNKDGIMKKYIQYHFNEYQLINDDKFHTIDQLKELHAKI